MSGMVFVHGIGGVRQDELESASWRKALLEGARLAGHARWADAVAAGDGPPIRFANYSDLFASSEGQGGGGEELDPNVTEILAELVRDSIDIQLAEDPDLPVRACLEEARAQLDPPGQAQGVIGLFGRVMNAVTALVSTPPMRAGSQWLAPKLMIFQLAQVARYLARGEPLEDGTTLDQRIRARVAE